MRPRTLPAEPPALSRPRRQVWLNQFAEDTCSLIGPSLHRVSVWAPGAAAVCPSALHLPGPCGWSVVPTWGDKKTHSSCYPATDITAVDPISPKSPSPPAPTLRTGLLSRTWIPESPAGLDPRSQPDSHSRAFGGRLAYTSRLYPGRWVCVLHPFKRRVSQQSPIYKGVCNGASCVKGC